MVNEVKIALVTCNVGGIDSVKDVPPQSVSYDYYCFTEHNLPFPLPNLNSRMKAKFIRSQMHHYLPHDVFIYIDGRVEVTSNLFVEYMVDNLLEHDIVRLLHYGRNNSYQELEFIISMMAQGNQYLLSRYGDQPMKEELDFITEKGLPKDYPLHNSGVFARWNNEKLNAAHDDWWQHIIRYSCFDQVMADYISWKHKLKTFNTPPINAHFKIGQHK